MPLIAHLGSDAEIWLPLPRVPDQLQAGARLFPGMPMPSTLPPVPPAGILLAFVSTEAESNNTDTERLYRARNKFRIRLWYSTIMSDLFVNRLQKKKSLLKK